MTGPRQITQRQTNQRQTKQRRTTHNMRQELSVGLTKILDDYTRYLSAERGLSAAGGMSSSFVPLGESW